MNLKPCAANIRKKTTMKIWAKENGFNYQTVIKLLNGFTGKKQITVTDRIIAKLKEDGFYEEGKREEAA